MTNKQINYTENDYLLVNTLRDATSPMTIAEISEKAGKNFAPGHITSAMKKGLIEKVGEVTVERPGTREVGSYRFVTMDAGTKADGTAYTYTDGEKAILEVISKLDKPFTLSELSELMGRKVASGSTNNLIRKGNIAKDENVTVAIVTKSNVGTYAFKAEPVVNA